MLYCSVNVIYLFLHLSLCCFVSSWVCMCPSNGAYEWKRGPVVKGWQWCHTSFALNEYLIKTLPFKSLSKALVLQSFQIQCSSWWWGAKQSVLFADCCLFLYSLFFFSSPLHTRFPSLASLCLCSFCALFLWMFLFCRKTPFMSSLMAACAFCL